MERAMQHDHISKEKKKRTTKRKGELLLEPSRLVYGRLRVHPLLERAGPSLRLRTTSLDCLCLSSGSVSCSCIEQHMSIWASSSRQQG